MKKLSLSLIFIGFTILAYTQEKGIRFETNQTWAQIKEKAKKERKFIFLDAYATWCGPCKFMDSIYKREIVGSFMNDRFISVKVQMDSTKNDDADVRGWYSTAKQMMTDYKITGFPSLLFFDPNGILVHKRTGARFDTTFVKIASMALKLETQYYTKLRTFKSGKLSFDRMPALAKEAREQQEYVESSEIAEYYINNFLLRLNERDLLTNEHLSFIGEYISPETDGFKLFMKNRKKVNIVLGENKAEYLLRNAISEKYIPSSASWKVSKPNWAALEKTMKSKFGDLGLEVLYGKKMIFYSKIEDWTNFGKYYVLYFEKALKRPEYYINNISWMVFLNVRDAKVLNFACNVVMKYAMEEWYSSFIPAYDTYANLLYKAGITSEAIQWEQRALKAEKGGSLEKIYSEILTKMKKGEPTWLSEAKK